MIYSSRPKISQELCKKCGFEVLPAMVRCRECGTPKLSPVDSKSGPLGSTKPVKHTTLPTSSDSTKNNLPQVVISPTEIKNNSIETSNPKQKTTSRIRTTCRKCQQSVKAPVSLAGTVIHCPKCGTKVSLPKLNQSIMNEEKEALSVSVSGQAELLDAIRNALKEAAELSIESKTKNDVNRRSHVKKLVVAIEACCGDSSGYETVKKAREAIQEMTRLQSVSGGESMLQLLPKLPDKVRPVVIRALGELQVKNALEPLLYSLLSTSTTEVEAAIQAIGDYGSISSVRPLLLLPSVHPNQRIRASLAISKLGEDALPVLLEVLENSSDEAIRFAVMESLKTLKSPKSVDSLLSVIQRDRTVLRRMAVEALGEIEHSKKHRVLVKLANDQDSQVRSIVLRALARKPHQSSIVCFVTALDDESTDVQKSALIGIGELGDLAEKSVVSSITKFLDSDDDELQFLAAQTISKLGDQRITPQILKLLKNELENEPDPEKIRSLVKCLQRLKDPRAVLPLCHLLERSQDSKTMRRVVEALGLIGDIAAKSAIENQLIRNESSDVRAAAAHALGTLGESAAVPVLIQALHDTQNVRIQALIALGKLKSTTVGPVIKEMLSDPSPTVRYQAINIVSESGDANHIASLVPLVVDSDEMVQRAAIKALNALGDERKEKELRKVATKSRRGKIALQVQHTLVPASVAGLFYGIPGGVATGVLTTSIFFFTIFFFIFFRSDATASGKVVVRGYVQGISVGENGEIAVVSRTRGLTEVWNLVNNERMWSGENVPTASGVVYNSRSETALFTTGKTVYFYGLSSDGSLVNLEENTLHDASILQIASSSNRQYTVTLDADQTMHLWSMEKKKSVSNRSLSAEISTVTVDNFGAKIATGGNHGTVQIWSPEINEPIYDNSSLMKQLKVTGQTNAIAFSNESKYLAHSTTSGELAVIELETGKLISKSELPPGATELYFNQADELIIVNAKINRLIDIKNSEMEFVTNSIRARTASTFCAETNRLLMGSDEEKPLTVLNIQTVTSTELDIE